MDSVALFTKIVVPRFKESHPDYGIFLLPAVLGGRTHVHQYGSQCMGLEIIAAISSYVCCYFKSTVLLLYYLQSP